MICCVTFTGVVLNSGINQNLGHIYILGYSCCVCVGKRGSVEI